MKLFKNISLLLIISAMLLSSCARQGGTSEPNIESVGVESNSSANGNITEVTTNSNTSENNGTGGGYFDLDRYYPDELCDIYLLTKIIPSKEVDRYTNDVYLKQDPIETCQLPDIYQFIKGLNISKEDFVEANTNQKEINERLNVEQTTYTDKQIEYMFGEYDEDTIKRELKSATTYYYDGRLYILYDIETADVELLREMFEKGDLAEYLENLSNYTGKDHLSQLRTKAQ